MFYKNATTQLQIFHDPFTGMWPVGWEKLIKSIGFQLRCVHNITQFSDPYNFTDMAKVRPSNLFLRPLDLFCYLEKQTI